MRIRAVMTVINLYITCQLSTIPRRKSSLLIAHVTLLPVFRTVIHLPSRPICVSTALDNLRVLIIEPLLVFSISLSCTLLGYVHTQ